MTWVFNGWNGNETHLIAYSLSYSLRNVGGSTPVPTCACNNATNYKFYSVVSS